MFGTHYAGFKPWYFNQSQLLKRYAEYEDFTYFFKEFMAMVWVDYPDLRKIKRLARMERDVRELMGMKIGAVPARAESAQRPGAAQAAAPEYERRQQGRRGQRSPARGQRPKGQHPGGKKSRRRG